MGAKQKLNEANRIMNEVDNDSSNFQSLFTENTIDGPLNRKTKNLVSRSPGISYHVNAAFNSGTIREELIEVGYVTLLMYSSRALMELNSLMDVINQFEPK